MKNKKIIIAGGSGFIGSELSKYFASDNEVVILSRHIKESDNKNIRFVQWNGKDAGDWCKEIDGSDVIINLTGKSVNCRYNEQNKKEILDSRINAAKVIGEVVRQSTHPPKLWLNAASATIYREARDKPQDEYATEIGKGFSVGICKEWEAAFFEQTTPHTRKVAMRISIVLGNGGVMVPYLNLCKFGLGGKQGDGKQMFSWIHVEDVCRIIDFVEADDSISGPINMCSPNPVPNKELMQTICDVTGNKIALPAYKWMLKLGAWMIGTETELILKSRWVLPTKLLEHGYTFQHHQLKEAVENIVNQLPRKRYRLF
jgi:uncharacterized protein (TIGR01777 family)